MSDMETCDGCGRSFRYFSHERGTKAASFCPHCLNPPVTERSVGPPPAEIKLREVEPGLWEAEAWMPDVRGPADHHARGASPNEAVERLREYMDRRRK